MKIVIRQVKHFINRNSKLSVIFAVFVTGVVIVGLWRFSSHLVQSEKEGSFFGNSVITRLDIDGHEIKILTKEYSSVIPGIIFLFLDTKTNGVINTLSVENYNIGPPTFHIIKGNKHDWLVTTKIAGDGTGYIRYIDDWYVMESLGNIKKVLSYPSGGNSDYSGSLTTFVQL